MSVVQIKNATGDDILEAVADIETEGHTVVSITQAADSVWIVFAPKPKRAAKVETR